MDKDPALPRPVRRDTTPATPLVDERGTQGVAMSNSSLTYVPREDTTPANERAVLAQIYEFALKRHREKAGAGLTADCDWREIEGAPADARGTRRSQPELPR